MKDKDLFYYMFENNSTKYNEVMHLIQNLEEINPEGITDEQKINELIEQNIEENCKSIYKDKI